MQKIQPLSIFEFFDTTLADTMPAVLGLWTTYSNPSDSAIAFMPNGETEVNIPLWRANLPADLGNATFHLTRSEETLIQFPQALNIAIDRVYLFIHTISYESELAFDLPSCRTTFAPPEQELLISLREIQAPDRSTSYGIGEAFAGYSQKALEQFQSFVERLVRVVAHYAWVETQMGGRTLARTMVGWLGDVDHIWQTGLNTTQISLHQRTVALALASRDALLRTFSTAVQLAVKLTVLLNVPGGVILLLPAAWKFVDQVITQSREGQTHEHI